MTGGHDLKPRWLPGFVDGMFFWKVPFGEFFFLFRILKQIQGWECLKALGLKRFGLPNAKPNHLVTPSMKRYLDLDG